MKKRLLSVLLAFLLICPAGSVFADDDPTPDPSPAPQGEVRQYIVQFIEPIDSGLLSMDETDTEKQIGPVDKHLYIMELDDTQYQQLLNDSNVVVIQPDGISHMLGVPDDPYYMDQWNMDRVGMADAWDIETGSEDVVVAVIDTGAAGHPDLTPHIVSPYDVVNDNTLFPNYANDGDSPAWHGTFVSGIVAAQTGNGEGVAGMAPGVAIMPINVFEWNADEADYIARDSSVIDAVYYAINHGADVINMSMGGFDQNPLLQQAIDDAQEAGIVVVAAAGNSNSDQLIYPASYEGVISVAATDESDQKASFSSYGSAIDLSAPGTDITGLRLTGYNTGQGTSFASPMVASLAALLLSHDPSLSPAQVESIMENHAADLGDAGWDPYFGEGRIDAYAALSSIETELSVTLIPGQESPQPVFTDISLSADVTEAGNYEYLFESGLGTGDWDIVRDWDTDNACTWTPGIQGEYTLRVSVRPEGGDTACSTTLSYTITAPVWTSLEGAIAVSTGNTDGELNEPGEQDIYKFTPAETGTYIIKTTGNTDTYGAVFDSTGALIAENDNGEDANFAIRPVLTGGSDYYIGVRHAGAGTGVYTLSIEKMTAPVNSVSLQADPADSCDYTVPVHLTVTITDGDAFGAQYRFQIRKSGSDWQTIRDFGEDNECTWTPGSEGTYDIRVFARNSEQQTDASDTVSGYIATGITGQEGVSISMDPSSGVECGTPVTLTATPQGDASLTERAEYCFYVKYNHVWRLVQDWSDSTTCVYTPSDPDFYKFDVRIRTKGRSGYDADARVCCNIETISKQEGVSISMDPSSGVECGTPVTLTATPQGDASLTERAEYCFYVKYNHVWRLVQDWSESTTCVYTPSVADFYKFDVRIRTVGRSGYDAGARVCSDVSVIPMQPGVALTMDKPPVQEAGTEITLTAQTTADGPLADRAEYQFQYKLGKNWTVLQDWSTDNTCTWLPDTIGTYTLRAYTRTAGQSGYDKYTDYNYEIDIQPLTSMTVTTDVASPQEADTAIHISAEAVGLHADNSEYLFRVQEGSKWKTLQDWSSAATCTWTPDKENMCTIEVQARSAGRNGVDVTAQAENYFIYTGGQPVDSLDVSVTPASPQEINTPVLIQAQARGVSADGTEQYLIRVKKGSRWTTLSEWGTDKEITWTPTSTGTYAIEVQARAAGRSGYDVVHAQDYTVVDIPVQEGVTLSTDLPNGQEYDTPITLIATPQGDASLTERAEYSYYYKYKNSWTLIQDWSGSATCVWTPSAPGSYKLEVKIRTEGRSNYDAYTTIPYDVGDIPEQPGVILTADKPPVQEAGTEIILAAQTTAEEPLAGRAEYQFQYKLNGSWTVLQNWSGKNTCTWIPDTKATYTLRAYTRTAGRSDYDQYVDYSYEIDIMPLTDVTLATDVESPQLAGTVVSLSAQAVGQHAAYAEYLFRVQEGSKWKTLQDWSSANTCTWTPGQENMCTIEVQARAAGRSGTDVTGKVENYFIYTGSQPVDSLDVSVTPASPQEIKTPVLIQAQAGGVSADGTEQYMVRVTTGHHWTTLSEWGADREITWTPDLPGTYTLEVQSRAAGRSGYDTIYTQDYTVVDIPVQEGVVLTTDIPSGEEMGPAITMTATPQGDEALTARAEYSYYCKYNNSWALIQDWSDSTTCLWTPSEPGSYLLEVLIRTEGRSEYDAYTTIPYDVEDIPQQPGVTLTSDIPPVQEAGTEITLTAQTTAEEPLAARAEYQFQYKLDGSWTVLKDWSSENTCTWLPDTKATYTLRAYTRTAGRSEYDQYADLSYEIDVMPLSRVTMTANPACPSFPETRVTCTAVAEGVYADTCEYKFTFHNGTRWYTGRNWSTTNYFVFQPSFVGVYKVKVEARSPGRSSVDVTYTMNYLISTEGAVSYTYSDDEMAEIQSQSGLAVKSSGSSWVPASFDDILYYVNPDNWLTGANKYQFLSLNYTTGITAADLDAIICDNPQNGGVLNGKGSVFLSAAQQYDINPAYLVSHSMLETGNGSSVLATGYNFNGTIVYNVFGICAYDSNPNYYGGQYAYNHGWTTVDKAITGGTKWIADNYIHNSSPQNTLYSMRWNPNAIQSQIDAGQTPHATHQYATDIAWAVKQVNRLKELMDRCVNAVLEFIIPDYD